MIPEYISLGQFNIYGLRDGFFYLDGGTMFGVVPKVLWEKIYPSDQSNRIKLGLNCLLIETGEKRVLVETGIGSLLKKKLYEYYSIEQNPGLVPSLQKIGLSVEDIDFVINTHLHFDHCGGNTRLTEEGEVRPTFPKALYVIQRHEWEAGINPTSRDRASYLNQFYLPLKEADQLHLVDGDTRITEGVEVVLASGHTSFHQCVKIRSQGKTLFFLGDMVPTSAHVKLPYIMSYDLFPLKTFENKKKYFECALKEDWLVALNHDPDYFFGKIAKEDNKYFFQPLVAP